MKMSLCLTLVCVASCAASANAVTPVQKVLTMLQGMLEKGKKEKHEEKVRFAASSQFCKNEEDQKVAAIKEETQTIDGLTAEIAKDTTQVAHLSKVITQQDKDLTTHEGDKAAATKVREIEKSDYDKLHQDYTESVSALERAIQTMKANKGTGKVAQKGSFTQLSTLQGLSLIPADAKNTLHLLLAQDSSVDIAEDLNGTAPVASSYEFQSHGVIAMLEKLLDKFIQERTTLEKKEANAKHAYEMLIQDLQHQINQIANVNKPAKEQSRAADVADKADKEGDKKTEEGLKTTDTRYLTDLKADCSMKAADYKSRQELRTGEIQAIEQAITIMTNRVAGNAEKHLPGLLQNSAASFAQLRSDSNLKTRERVVTLLRSRAAEVSSRVLFAAAARAAADPLAKVKKMIKDLVVRLVAEANEESSHKGWCDTELSTNAQTRKQKTASVEKLHSEIDSLSASIAKTTEDMRLLAEQMAQLSSALAKATTLRTEEKAKNEATIADAKASQTAVAEALTVLREFYAKAGDATALLQQPYKGMQDDNKGVTGMLEVIESDFARLHSETKAAEATAQEEHNKFSSDTKVDNASKATASEHMAAKKQDETQALTQKKNDLEGTQKELDASLAYYDKLRPSCVDTGASYEDRVARRKEEMESLQTALKILAGDDIA